METAIEPAKTPGTPKLSQKPSEETATIMKALTIMAVKRGTEVSPLYLRIFSEMLSKEPLNLVLEAIEDLGKEMRQHWEPACPSLGVILNRVRLKKETPGEVRHIVLSLAKHFAFDADEQMLSDYEEVLGHRTLEDLDKGRRSILRNGDLKRMPTPGQLADACGFMHKRREGR